MARPSEQKQLREIFKLIGRAVSLSAMYAVAKSENEDYVMERMDKAWEKLADAVYAFTKEN